MSIFLYPHPSIEKVLIYNESSENAKNVWGYRNWIGGWGGCELCIYNVLSLLISTKKCISLIMTLFMMSSFKNQFENDVITTDMISAGIHLLNYYSFDILNHFHFKTN